MKKQTNQQLFFQTLIGFLLLFFVMSISCNVIKQKDQDSDSVLEGQGLYNANDLVIILNDTNFKTTVYNSQKAWFVEFYNSWCGFCHKFAPTWKSLAKNIYGWKSIVVIAAVDCANDDNNPLCREFEVMRYPTLKFFPVNANKNFLGLELQIGNNENEIRNGIVDQLQKEQQEQRGGTAWPNIVPYWGSEIINLWNGIPQNVEFEFLIFEQPDSYLGAEVILDLHKLDIIRIRRIVADNEPLCVTSKVTTFPSLKVLNRDNSQSFLKIQKTTREGIRDSILQFLKSKGLKIDIQRNTDAPDNHVRKEISKHNIEKKYNNFSDHVYQIDLENTLHYSLNNEISLSINIFGKKLEALKMYLQILSNYFPVNLSKGEIYLQVLTKVVESRSNITGNNFKEQASIIKNLLMRETSGQRTWIGCKGSSLHFRGYPCGVWTMFHVLTVIEANEFKSSAKNKKSISVLTAMHEYIKYFFGCSECSGHFQEMAKKRKIFEVNRGDESILWLWRAHNEVNQRLSGDDTEDPVHKKIQYPASENCLNCRLIDGTWDENEVLKYLKIKYSKLMISLQGVSNTKNQLEIDASASITSANRQRLDWGLPLDDISICVILYAMSAALLTMVCLKFACKRNYRKIVSFQYF